MRIAILGCGSIGGRHARNLRGLGHADLILYDPIPGLADSLARDFGVRSVDGLDGVWAYRPDTAIVAAPSFQHVPLALDAARHGCDIFVEKPLGVSHEGVADLLGEVAARQLITMVACNMRFHPGPSTVHRLLVDGAIGTALSARLSTGSYLPSWRPGRDYRESYSAQAETGGGALLDCIHEIDLALWFFGPARLRAAVVLPAKSIGLDVDGLAELLLEHAGGIVSSVHLNFIQRDYKRGCQIVGTDGTIYWDFAGSRVLVRFADTTVVHDLMTEWDLNTMYVDEMTHFLTHVASRTETIAPLSAGIAALDLALAARDAARSTCA